MTSRSDFSFSSAAARSVASSSFTPASGRFAKYMEKARSMRSTVATRKLGRAHGDVGDAEIEEALGRGGVVKEIEPCEVIEQGRLERLRQLRDRSRIGVKHGSLRKP